MWETWVRSLGWEDPLEEGMATHSSILAWRIPMDGGAWRATVPGVVAHSTAFSKAIDLRKAPLLGDWGFLSQQHPCPALHVYHGFLSQQDSPVVTTAICLSGKHLYFCLGETSLVFTGLFVFFFFLVGGVHGAVMQELLGL